MRGPPDSANERRRDHGDPPVAVESITIPADPELVVEVLCGTPGVCEAAPPGAARPEGGAGPAERNTATEGSARAE
jgi:hypothetical protein